MLTFKHLNCSQRFGLDICFIVSAINIKKITDVKLKLTL